MNAKLKILLLAVGLILTCGLVAASQEPQHVYHKVTPAVFQGIKTFTENYGGLGIQIPDGKEGDISCLGSSVHFTYDGAECLTLQITSKPSIFERSSFD